VTRWLSKTLRLPGRDDGALRTSEERWRSLVDSAPDIILTADERGRIEFANRGLAGLPKEKVIGTCVHDYVEGWSDAMIQGVLRSATTTGKAVSLEARGRFEDAEPGWYAIRVGLFKRAGAPDGLMFFVTSITLRKDLEMESERFRLLLNRAREGILVVDADQDGQIVDVNETALSLLGYTRREMLERRLAEFESGTETAVSAVKTWNERVQGILDRGGSNAVEGFWRRHDGSTFPVESFKSLYKFGGKTYMLVMAQDVTLRRRMEAQIEVERAKAVFTAKMATLGEMAGGVAHEINNPVAIVDGLAQQLGSWADAGTLDPAKVRTQAKKISDTVLRIAKIVRGLRAFSRDATHDPFVATSLKTILDDTAGLCAEAFRKWQIGFEVAAFDPALKIECRATELSQVILNLLSNARDAVKALEERWIRVEVLDQGDFVEIMVTDSGRGIPEAVRPRLMQPFFTTKDVGQGTGLGLSISKGLVEAHAGRLLYDETSRNTRFLLFLPKVQRRVA
jgi:PAS domain S-box-containing protein